ncbi:MAG TPA: serine hydrolase [Puia sp.]|nr:serine hydrolase [Puia sp.]
MKFYFLWFLVPGLFGFIKYLHSPGHHPSTRIFIIQSDTSRDNIFLEELMKKYPQYFDRILRQRDSLRVQIIYTQIDRDAKNNPSFKNYYFNVNPNKYFYPASTVKMPVALLALQRLQELRLPGLNKYSSMVTEKAYSGQTAVFNDPTTPDGRPSVAQYIKKIFLVSDNYAFNRLYEFLGQEYINESLHRMGYDDVQIRHRLEIALTEDENRHTNPVTFYDPSGKLIYQQPMQFNQQSFAVRNDSLGKGFYSNEQFVGHAMDFSKKNRISLEDLHNILRSILFPNSVPERQRFNITDEDYNFVWQYMSQYPSETKYPYYDTADYWDAYGKLLFWGSEKNILPKNIRIFNKEGDAYGFLNDISYFVDFDKHVEFMLSASIYCNSDEILNDEKYDYDSLGLPFLKQIGKVIYDYETKRTRANIPGLLKFRLKYDK